MSEVSRHSSSGVLLGLCGLAILCLVAAIPAAGLAQGGSSAGKAAKGEGRGEVTQTPKLLEEVEADYTEEALEAEVEGAVELKLTLDEEGNVVEAEVVDGLGHGLDRAAREAARQFEFRPAKIDGKPAPVSLNFRVQFRLPERPGAIRGRVEARGDGAAVAGVTVELEATDGPGKKSVRTGGDGAFRFDEVPPGAYRVEVDPPEYRERSRPVEVGSGETVDLTVTLDSEPVRFEGRILEAGTRDPLSGVELKVRRAGEEEVVRRVYTGEGGRFEIRGLPVRAYEVEVSAAGYRKRTYDEAVVPDERTVVTYYLRAKNLDEMTATTTARREEQDVQRRNVSFEEVERIPGPASDPVRAVQNLPGVARPSFGSGQVAVRGSSPQSTATFIEGDEIPVVYHFFGGPAVINTEMIDSVDFYPGNFGARYGRALGGVIDLQTRTPKRDRPHAFAEIDALGAAAKVEGPIGDDVSFAVAGRRSYIDAILPALIPEGEVGLRVAPRYYDYQGWLTWDVAEDHQLELFAYGTNDTVEALFDEPQGDARIQVTRVNVDNGSHRGQLRWNWEPDDRPVENRMMVSLGRNRVGFEAAENIFFNLNFRQIQVRDDFEWELADWVTLGVGADVQIGNADVEAEFPDADPNDGGGGGQDGGAPNLGDRGAVFDRQGLWQLFPAVYAEADWTPTESLTLTPGLRLDYFGNVDELAPAPRFNARWEVTDRVTAKGGIGRFTQPPEPGQTNESFGNPDLDFQKATHTMVGAEYRPSDAIELDTTLFYRGLDDLVVQTDEVRVDQGNGTLEPLIYSNEGDGRAYGAEVMLRHYPANNFFGWAAYTLSRSERFDPETGEWQPFEYDQTHNLTLVAGYGFDWNVDVSARFRLTTGNPRTPIVGSVWNADTGDYAPVRGARNSTRNPTFHQLDLRVDKTFVFNTWQLGVFVDVLNAYNAKNVEGRQYNYDYSESEPVSGLPIIPTLGLNARY